ncbi:hypothetical protein AOL_s00140g102 [Orbilia oligospora ATCC 24927]|uniref:Uncharacterized protein n=1 Tax=Arthrobotrys oligospora (strain ATCC 24927 / CBS 115.81 / DSM 1491) TaxID=756982 RepID=G1XMD3_ARTOA|nr:hypothetical protein AOL_s00140g102 [Orbilia oligospora ATCC 24927]EGX45786.1 hypothetical protein AOL_s00140g102 [Orbilia oligospora ATCC 24927]
MGVEHNGYKKWTTSFTSYKLDLWWLWDGRKILRAPSRLKLENIDFYGNTVAWVTASGHLAVMEFDQVGIERFEKWQYGRSRPRGDGERDRPWDSVEGTIFDEY